MNDPVDPADPTARTGNWPDPDLVLAALATAPARLGATKLVCIDGLAGSGKTTLARTVGEATGGTVLHTDDLIEGWGGLPGLGTTLAEVLRPLASGRDSAWTRWDWHADGWGETVLLPVPEVLIIEGVGSGVGSHRDLVSLLVWVEADAEDRLRRGLTRDGVQLADEWRQWLRDEASLHELAGTATHADLRFRT